MSTGTAPEMSDLNDLRVWHEVAPCGTMIIPPQTVTIKITGLAAGGCRVEALPGGAEATPAHLWPCGCLRNDAGAHRAGCPDDPEGVGG